MTHVSILDFSFQDGESRSTDLAFLQTVLHLNVQHEHAVYTTLADDNGLIIGLMNVTQLDGAVHEGYQARIIPNFSLAADDFDTTIEQALQSGGRVIMPKTTIEGTGYFAIVQTPSGVNLALVEAKSVFGNSLWV